MHAPLPSWILHTPFDGQPDLVFDLSSGPVDDSAAIRLLFDGLTAPAAAVSAILDGRSPRLDLVGYGKVLGSAFPANEEPGSLTAGLAASFARCVDLCLREVARRRSALPPCSWHGRPQARDGTSQADAAVSSRSGSVSVEIGEGRADAGNRYEELVRSTVGDASTRHSALDSICSSRSAVSSLAGEEGAKPEMPEVVPAGGTAAFRSGQSRSPVSEEQEGASSFSSAAFRFGVANLAEKVQRRITRMLTAPESWRIGYRRLGGPSILETASVPETGYTWLPDDGRRFLADPFLIEHRGRTWLFCEEFPYATQTGIISVCEIGADGLAGPMRPVLETGTHLSYPYIFAQGDEIWMIPESSAARDVVLYRATDFPFCWQAERKLLDGIAVADATPIMHEERLWLFASLIDQPGGSSWDALGLFHAPNLFGDFTAHPLNPVLIDAASARPAGRMYRQGSNLMRLSQDCRARYGAATTVAVIDRLDPEGYAQTVTHRIAPPPIWKAAGLHTIDVGGGFEAIDVISRRPPVS
ncbi:glucosamine inositolphosphorylceramide transferase family protein [Methylobacterium haplocladii]|uniref:glucosamine inositolphosphorylceramide transferase family protein n=1 Tax=Methylobacterium haplocladii TaxID=1176176 RepID=UPI0011BEAA51|nr:hypothetical protein [Methylobacterium haplocladii]